MVSCYGPILRKRDEIRGAHLMTGIHDIAWAGYSSISQRGRHYLLTLRLPTYIPMYGARRPPRCFQLSPRLYLPRASLGSAARCKRGCSSSHRFVARKGTLSVNSTIKAYYFIQWTVPRRTYTIVTRRANCVGDG